MALIDKLPMGVEFRRIPEVEGMLELTAPGALYLVLTNDLVTDDKGAKNVLIASNLPKEIANKMADVFVAEMRTAATRKDGG
jgi:hypothetical protein